METPFQQKEAPLTITNWFSFHTLNFCQFIGAMNDNLFKLLLVYCFIHIEGPESSNKLLSLTGVVFVMPFLFLAPTAGTLADRYSKRSIILITRGIEIVSLSLGALGLTFGLKSLSFIALFMLACHSALFGPSKYGIIPELVAKKDISKANGLLTLCTYTAMIIGTFLASFLTDISNYDFMIASLLPILFSLTALIMAFKIEKTPASGSHKKISLLFVHEMVANLRTIRKEPFLLSAVLGSAFFLFAGSFIQLNVIPYAIYSLNLTDVQGGYMFLLTALGIGVGSYLAGKFSGKAVEFGLIPIGGFGLSICFFMLHGFSDSLPLILSIMFLIGISGGLYLVPLDSYIQIASPPTQRGQIVATSNFFGFVGVLISALLLYCSSEILHLTPSGAFVLMGALVLPVILLLTLSLSGYVIRFLALLVSSCFAPSSLKGKEQVSLDHPSFFLVPLSFWPWTPIVMASQRNRVHVYTTASLTSLPFLVRLLLKGIPVIEIRSVDDLYPNKTEDEIVRHSIKRNCSLILLTTKKNIEEHAKELTHAWKETPEGTAIDFFQVKLHSQEEKEFSTNPWATSLSAELIPLSQKTI